MCPCATGCQKKTSLVTLINLCTCLTFAHVEARGFFVHFLNENCCILTQSNGFICSALCPFLSALEHVLQNLNCAWPSTRPLNCFCFHDFCFGLFFSKFKSNWNFLYESFHWLQACTLKVRRKAIYHLDKKRSPLGETFFWSNKRKVLEMVIFNSNFQLYILYYIILRRMCMWDRVISWNLIQFNTFAASTCNNNEE